MSIKKPKWGMLIDASKCVGCHACRIACQNQNRLKVREYYNRIEEQESGEFPDYSRRFIPIQCQHCDNPPCVKVCPVGACYKREDGVVFVDREKCIGCKYCVLACPYNAPVIQEDEEYVHDGDSSDITYKDLCFLEELIFNAFNNILNHLQLFKGKQDLIKFTQMLGAEKTLGIKSRIRPKTMVYRRWVKPNAGTFTRI